ncbi:photosystem II 11 kDa protein-like protein [Wolffia australiana]
MDALFSPIFSAKIPSLSCPKQSEKRLLPSRKECDLQMEQCSRRIGVLHGGASLIAVFVGCLTPWQAKAEDEDLGLVDAIKSAFDPNEKTKSGRTLPKAYLKSAREVVKTLRESLGEDAKDLAKFRRNADAAKESIREFLGSWRGQKAVSSEESYTAIEKAIRSLAGFYAKAGPFASLPDDIKNTILEDLNTADASL